MNSINRMFFLIFLSSSLTVLTKKSYCQSKDSVVVIGSYTQPNTSYQPNSKGLQNKGRMPNSLEVSPQLTDKLVNNKATFNAFRLKDGMTCITPDSTIDLKLRIVRNRKILSETTNR